MNKFLLKLVALFNPFWRSLGVDTKQLAAILGSKLLMDQRRVKGFGNNSKNEKKQKNQNTTNLLLYFIMGVFLMTTFVQFEHLPTGMTLFFSAWMVLLIMTLITDFTEVLIDVRDNYIILPQPVNDRTVTISRILHVLLYLSKLAFAFMIPSVIYIIIKYGWLGILIFGLQFSLSVIIAIFFVNLVYLIILNVTSIARFKEIIGYFQIAFSILIFGGYYLLPRLLDFEQLQEANVLENPITYLLPSAWIASIWEVLINGIFQTNYIIMSVLALITPVLFLILIIRVLAKQFSQKMMAITAGNSTQRKEKKDKKPSLLLKFALRLGKNQQEKAGIEWIWKMMQRSRDYKLRVYPSLAFIPMFFVYMAFTEEGTLGEKIVALQASDWYIVLIYFCVMLFATPFLSTQYNEKSKTAWIFHTLPIRQPGALVMSAFWASLVKFFIPTYLLMLATGLSIWGIKVLDDFLLGLMLILLFGVIMAMMLYEHLPFSESWKNQAKGGNFVRNIFSVFVISLLGLAHYSISDFTYMVWSATILVASIFLFAVESIRKKEWQSFKN
ncbi:MAG: hypothetical protein AAGI49_09000 [Bacteroidota bacterium]